jgi:hypothetical protein
MQSTPAPHHGELQAIDTNGKMTLGSRRASAISNGPPEDQERGAGARRRPGGEVVAKVLAEAKRTRASAAQIAEPVWRTLIECSIRA